MWFQKEIQLGNYARGFHLITEDVLRQIPELKRLEVGLLHVFIKHTSASLTLNENADSSVRDDFESFINHLVPEDEPYYTHTYEGSDDMPAHLKSSLLGASVTIPISKGRLNLGTWQGLYLCEHRDGRHRRQLVLTLQGE
ncbi:MAG TPA: hypothetical protein DHW71_04335 [Gammaproteobacteria bacterium]|nr:hypothetical protein [Gammaproteobacteria bacterium]MEC8011440.1 secondary thiamine-phosphate synthase enzyme YjbQ [Pseudomonadota bacterium]HBF09300.1 hypothetical protein [Gammaproteobacteria bacterium]HCK92189.1 hypothetical protein [Gammaproteobacteria bacterium]|tara:strand:- start:57 stop:476 length:420 start_codon:yes stop_codon:yes gene_type:complete